MVPPVGTFSSRRRLRRFRHSTAGPQRANRAAHVGSLCDGSGRPYSPYAASPFAPTPGVVSEPISESFTIPSLPPNWYESAAAPEFRLIQSMGLSTAYIGANGGDNKLGVTETNLFATFAVPILYEQARS